MLKATQSGQDVLVHLDGSLVMILAWTDARELADQLARAANAAEIERICGHVSGEIHQA